MSGAGDHDPDHIAELFGGFGPVTVRRMFGGAGLFAGGVMIAMLDQGVIYLKADERTIPALADRFGAVRFLWASDFPHEATRTDMRKLVKEHFDRKDLSREAKKKIIYDNAKRFYAL